MDEVPRADHFAPDGFANTFGSTAAFGLMLSCKGQPAVRFL